MATDYPEARALVLAAILPAGTDVYVALFYGDPIDGGSELALAGYSRAAHQDWLTTDLGGSSKRANVGAITFGPISEAGKTTHWAIYDSAAGGTLLRSGHINNNVGAAVDIDIGVGDDFVFASGELEILAQEI